MGRTVTYYTPVLGGAKARGSATYVGNVVGEIVGPPGIITAGPNRASSNYTYVIDPG